MRRLKLLVAASFAVLTLAGVARAQLAVCSVSGTLYVNGLVSPNTRVTFVLDAPTWQIATHSVVRPSQAMRVTDSNGNMAAINLPQGVKLKVIVGQGPPVQVSIPNSASTTLTALLP